MPGSIGELEQHRGIFYTNRGAADWRFPRGPAGGSDVDAIVVRGRLGYEVRREIPPWTMMGREELAEDELAVWQRLDAGTLNAVAAVARQRPDGGDVAQGHAQRDQQRHPGDEIQPGTHEGLRMGIVQTEDVVHIARQIGV